MLHAANDARFWDRVARKYATDTIKDMAGYERTVERTRDLLQGTDRVLEIGCGTGTTALKLAPYVAGIEACDVSSEMIAIARERATEQSCRNAAFFVEDAKGPQGHDGAYDAILAFNLLHLIADLGPMLCSVHRRLRPGGLFISKTPCLGEMNPLLRVAVPVARAIGKAPYVSFFSALDLEAAIATSGFTICARERHGSGGKDARIFIVAIKPDIKNS